MNSMSDIRPRRLVIPFFLIALMILTASIASARTSRATIQVEVSSFEFSPANITINVGDTVEWNQTSGTHNVFSTGVFRCANGCDSTGGNGAPASGTWTAEFTFDTPGTYDYVCQLHSSMRGQIVVEAAPALPEVYINEIRIDDVGNDDNEYVELFGAAGTSLSDLTYLVIGDGSGGSGVIESATSLVSQTIPASGYFVMAKDTFTLTTATITESFSFENNDNVTHLLVSNFTGANGDDLDTNDDGTLDVTPWAAVVDAVGLVEKEDTPTAGEFYYGAALGFSDVGPDGSFVPAHVYRLPDGNGRVPTGGWNIGEFDLGITDTPGRANAAPTAIALNQASTSTSSALAVMAVATTLLTLAAGNLIWRRND